MQGRQLFASIAYFILTRALVALHGTESRLATAVGSDVKGKIPVVICFVSIPLASLVERLAFAPHALVAIVRLGPERRIERSLTEDLGEQVGR